MAGERRISEATQASSANRNQLLPVADGSLARSISVGQILDLVTDGIVTPASVVSGYVPTWSTTSALGAGYAVGSAGQQILASLSAADARTALSLGTAATLSSGTWDTSGQAASVATGLGTAAYASTAAFDQAGAAASVAGALGGAAYASVTAFDSSGAAASVASGLGSAAYLSAGAFDSSGQAASVYGSLSTHAALDTAHGITAFGSDIVGTLSSVDTRALLSVYSMQEVDNKDEFEVVFVDGAWTIQPKQVHAADPLRLGTATATCTTTDGSFTNAGANLTHGTGYWQNNIVTGIAAVSAATGNVGAGTQSTWDSMHDGITASGGISTDGASAGQYFQYDLGTAQDGVKFRLYYNGPIDGVSGSTWQLQYSDSPSSGYSNVPGVSLDTRGGFTASNYWEVSFSSVGSHRYWRLVIGARRNSYNYTEWELYTSAYAATSNTIDSPNLIPSGSVSFAPATLVVRDESAVAVSGGLFNVAYSTDGTNFSPLISGTAFLALATITSTVFKLRLQPVGSQKIGSSEISNISTSTTVHPEGRVRSIVNGVTMWDLSSDGAITAGAESVHSLRLSSLSAAPSSLAGYGTLWNLLGRPAWSGLGLLTLSSDIGTAAYMSAGAFDAAGKALSVASGLGTAAYASTGAFDSSGVAASVASGLGSAAYLSAGAFDSSGQAASVYGSLSTHAALTSTAHGMASFGYGLTTTASAADARTTLGLGTIATEVYETGTWTPSMSFSSQTGSFTFTTQTGRYTKIGRQVFAEVTLAWSAIPSAGSLLYVDNFPFTAAAAGGCGTPCSAVTTGSWTGSSPAGVQVLANATSFILFRLATGTSAGYGQADIPSSANLTFSVVYDT